MRLFWVIMSIVLVALTLALLAWLGSLQQPTAASEAERNGPGAAETLRLSLIPERDIFEQRRRYQRLAAYLGPRLGCDVQVVTQNTYEAALADLENGAADGAFLGSFVSVLAMDRCGAKVLVKPETSGGVTTYRGVLFVREGSPIRSVTDLAGKSIAMVRATTAGDLFPIAEMKGAGILDGDNQPTIRWVGTHDEAIHEVMEGRVDAGAAKDLRLDAYRREHPQAALVRLAESAAVPNNALLLTPTAAARWGEGLREVLLGMSHESEGQRVLAEFGADRFVPANAAEYESIHRMVEALGDDWQRLGVSGAAPRRVEITSVDEEG